MAEAKIAAKLPKTEAANGLNSVARKLLEDPHEVRYAVVAIDCGGVDTRYEWDDFGERTTVVVPRARIRAIEPLDGTAAMSAHRMMDVARGDRTGRPMLALDFGRADAE